MRAICIADLTVVTVIMGDARRLSDGEQVVRSPRSVAKSFGVRLRALPCCDVGLGLRLVFDVSAPLDSSYGDADTRPVSTALLRLPARVEMQSAGVCCALRSQALAVCVLCLDARVAKSFVERVSTVANDAAA